MVNLFRKPPAFLIFILILSFQLIACSSETARLVKGAAVPQFSLLNLQKQQVQFPQQFKNQVVLISFWADWCPACKKELHDFETLFQKYHKKGLKILAINIDQNREVAMAFIDDLNLSYEILFDEKAVLARRYSVTSLPSALIVDRDGLLHTRILGETPAEVFEEIIKQLL